MILNCEWYSRQDVHKMIANAQAEAIAFTTDMMLKQDLMRLNREIEELQEQLEAFRE
jgi:hypothetical protein